MIYEPRPKALVDLRMDEDSLDAEAILSGLGESPSADERDGPLEVRILGMRYVMRVLPPPHETGVAVDLRGAVLPVVYGTIKSGETPKWKTFDVTM